MEGALAIVTGTTRGLGAALAEELLVRGWRVVGIARGDAPTAFAGRAYTHLSADLADVVGLARRMQAAPPAGPDVGGARRLALVNNAALLHPGPTHRLDARALADALLVGAAAPTWLMGWAVRAAGSSPLRIVNVSSGAATSPYAGWSAYCQSKAALDMASQVLGAELADVPDLGGRDIAVVSYAPGVVDTAMQAEIRATDPSDFPHRDRFVGLHERGELVAPAAPAREIADLLATERLPPFSRRRFGGG